MKLGRFMDDAYRGLNKGRSLRSEKGDPIFDANGDPTLDTTGLSIGNMSPCDLDCRDVRLI